MNIHPMSYRSALLTFFWMTLAGIQQLFAAGTALFPEGWASASPRDEIRPAFSFDPKGGFGQAGAFVISHDAREGLDGWFEKSFPVNGGAFYRVSAVRKAENVAVPRHCALMRVVWQDDHGKSVPAADPPGPETGGRPLSSAEPEHPEDGPTDAHGWTTVSGVYHAPVKATRALVELHLQHAPNGRIAWSDVVFEKTAPPAPRKVRLATVHYFPHGKTPRENCEEFAPHIAEAAQQRADRVVLGETVPTATLKSDVIALAEPIPGPSTDYFGALAEKHRLHIVFSLYERSGHLVYNTAVLLGPDGKLLGKYRKVCLPHSEVAKGIAPGHDYPVFDTALGKIGMMVCYDGFFPEVARELTNRGAEIIAWPVWGCNQRLAQARACENKVFLISSTFMKEETDWMISAIFDRGGTPIAKAGTWGSVVVAEVDLSRPSIGPYNLGDFRAMVPRHRP